jgi:hypothetical protein
MMRNVAKSLVLLFSGALLGAGLVASLNAAQEYRSVTGYPFWSKAEGNLKFAYLIGYSDAEQMYRLALDKGAKPLCADAGREWIEDFDRKIPMPNNISVKQTSDGIDEFYKDWRNQGVHLYFAQNVVRLQITGRPQAEIEEAIRKAREAASDK